MIDRDALERAALSFRAPEDPFGRLLRRRQRRRRLQRIAAGCIAVAIVGACLALAIAASHAPGPRPADRGAPTPETQLIDPSNVAQLRPSWSASIPHLAPGSPASTDGDVLVYTRDGFNAGSIVAFPVDCRTRSCPPSWIGGAGDDATPPVAGGGIVYTAGSTCVSPSENTYMCTLRVLAFDAACASDAGSCRPLWTSDGIRGAGGVDKLVLVPGGVVAGGSFYPATCSDPCEATFVDRSWNASGPPTVVGDVIVFPEQKGIAAYPLDCFAQGSCEPAWTAHVPEAPDAVAALGDAVGVLAGGRTLTVFSTCPSDGGTCAPAWSASSPLAVGPSWCPLWTAEYDAGVVLLVGTACAGDSGAVTAYPIGCRSDGGVCAPTWTWTSESRVTGFAVADGAAYVTSGGRVRALSVDCSPAEACLPAWSAPGDGMPFETLAGSGLVWVTRGTQLLAYPATCGSDSRSCEPAWSEDVGDRRPSISIEGPQLFVAARDQLTVWSLP